MHTETDIEKINFINHLSYLFKNRPTLRSANFTREIRTVNVNNLAKVFQHHEILKGSERLVHQLDDVGKVLVGEIRRDMFCLLSVN